TITAATLAPSLEDSAALRRFRTCVLRAAFIAGVGRILEKARTAGGLVTGYQSNDDAVRLAEGLAARGAPVDIVAGARLLAARSLAMKRQWDRADPMFEQAITEAERADATPRT